MVNWRNTRPPKLEGENEITSVFEMVLTQTHELGFTFCSFTMSSQLADSQTKPIHIDNYSNEWNTLYQRAHFFDVDPVVTHCKRSVLPIVWEEKTFTSAPDLWSLAQSFGVHRAWTQPFHDAQGKYSMLTLARSDSKVTPEELYEKAGRVLWLCNVLHSVTAPKYAAGPNASPCCKLTKRETEILKWSALGKTAGDIAVILCLSERTVGFHMKSTFNKLGVNNKIAAVLRAYKEGYLF